MNYQVAIVFLMALTALKANELFGQPYPNKPIHIITSEAGGTVDFASRLIAPGLSIALNQPVVVDNRASGLIPGQTLSLAPPDGYTLLVTSSSVWLITLVKKAPYDPVKDFSSIALLGKSPSLLVVTPTLPAKSVKELVDLARARPGELNNSIGGIGASGHLAGELFKSMAGVNIVAVPYANGSQELADLVSGRVQLTITNPGSIREQIKAGKLRVLAVTSAQPSSLFPGLPPIAATLPGYEMVTTTCVFAPNKTSEAIINLLYKEIAQLVNQADIKDKFLNAGIEVVGGTPQELSSIMRSEIARMRKIINDAGISAP